MIRAALVALVIPIAVPAAADPIPGPISCDVLSVYDGDTFTAACHPWPQATFTVSVRVNGVDTPEIKQHARCEEENTRGLEARDAVRGLVGSDVTVENVFLGKYAGRVVADVYVGTDRLADILIALDLGRAYDGGRREGWCD